MWVPLKEGAAAGTPTALEDQTAKGPLAAFGHVHRALRANEKRILSVSGEVDQIANSIEHRVSHAAKRMEQDLQQDGYRIRTETSELFADLEALVLQVYEEHEAAILEEREANRKLRATIEAEQAAHRAALTAQQGQIDALAAAMRRQQEVLDAHLTSTATQMKAMQAETTELHRALKAQSDSSQATKELIGSVDEKFKEQLANQASSAESSRMFHARVHGSTGASPCPFL